MPWLCGAYSAVILWKHVYDAVKTSGIQKNYKYGALYGRGIIWREQVVKNRSMGYGIILNGGEW